MNDSIDLPACLNAYSCSAVMMLVYRCRSVAWTSYTPMLVRADQHKSRLSYTRRKSYSYGDLGHLQPWEKHLALQLHFFWWLRYPQLRENKGSLSRTNIQDYGWSSHHRTAGIGGDTFLWNVVYCAYENDRRVNPILPDGVADTVHAQVCMVTGGLPNTVLLEHAYRPSASQEGR